MFLIVSIVYDIIWYLSSTTGKILLVMRFFEAIKEILLGISERYYLDSQDVGHTKDHLHILVEVSPIYSASDVMQICNSMTAKHLFKKSPDFEEELLERTFLIPKMDIMILLEIIMMRTLWRIISIKQVSLSAK